MKTARISLALLILLGFAISAPDTPQLAQDKPEYRGVGACNRALELTEKGRPAEAIELLEQTRDTVAESDLWLWWGNKGLAHRDLREDEKALECFGKAVELNPECWFRMRRAILLHQFGRWDEALDDLAVEEASADPARGTRELKAVIEGPFKHRWPHAWKKLEMTSPLGNYRIVSDFGITEAEMDKLEAECAELDPEDRRDARKLEKLLEPTEDLEVLCDLMEHVRQKYMKFVGMKKRDWPKGRVIKVFFFSTQEGFDAFSRATDGTGSEHALGFYDPNYRYMQIYSVRSGRLYYGIDEETIDTLIHEGWHQFFHVLCENRPIWLDEGLAEFLAKFKVHRGGKDIELGVLVRTRGDFYTRYERIREVVREGNHIPFRDFFRLNDESWRALDTRICYAQGWGVAYWALKGKRNKKFQKAYIKFFWDCVEGKPHDELLEEHFPDDDLEAYEEEWLEFIKGL